MLGIRICSIEESKIFFNIYTILSKHASYSKLLLSPSALASIGAYATFPSIRASRYSSQGQEETFQNGSCDHLQKKKEKKAGFPQLEAQ